MAVRKNIFQPSRMNFLPQDKSLDKRFPGPFLVIHLLHTHIYNLMYIEEIGVAMVISVWLPHMLQNRPQYDNHHFSWAGSE